MATKKKPTSNSKSNSMQTKKSGQYKTTKKHRQIVEQYDRANTQSIRLKLNKKTDKDILDKLNKSGNKQGTIKRALRGQSSKKSKKKK